MFSWLNFPLIPVVTPAPPNVRREAQRNCRKDPVVLPDYSYYISVSLTNPLLKQFLGVWLVLVFYCYILSNRHACLKQPKSITMQSWNSEVWNKFHYCRIKVLSELYFFLRLCLWEILFLSVLSSRICILNWQFFPLFHSHCIRSSVFFFFWFWPSCIIFCKDSCG